ncbi:Uncharacterised protein [uncultured archaeon]|nr:Uncharacterised protein [uncultured archaeon]
MNLVQPNVAHLVGMRCFSKATRRLGVVDRAVVTSAKNLALVAIFDDGETHHGHAAEFQAVQVPTMTKGDREWLTKLGVALWEPKEY